MLLIFSDKKWFQRFQQKTKNPTCITRGMGQKYLIDTNVLIDAQMSRLSDKALDFLAKAIDENFIISFITQIEYLG